VVLVGSQEEILQSFCIMTSTAAAPRICLIGSGPTGMSVLYHYDKLKKEGRAVPEIVCYEKQGDWGGLWNYDWRTGVDDHGEPVHGSMYRYLWSNGPKEASLEFPDYTFEEHFGKPIPSFPPREVLFDYLKGRWNKADLRKYITFKTAVRNVTYNKDSDTFGVVIEDFDKKTLLPIQTFDYVIVAIGHYSVPFTPYYPGVERFPGRVMHSHDFRDACEFAGKRLLVVGSSYSAEDIALQTVKYGAEQVICTYRSAPMGFKWPPQISERPLFTKVEGKTVHFSDGSTADVDAIIFCTGYLNHFPFMAEDIRLRSPNKLYPPNLYKGTIYTQGGNNKCLYVGMQDQYYTYTMFDAQARWAMKYLVGDVKLPNSAEMEEDIKKWVTKNENLKDCHAEIDFQSEFVTDLAKNGDYGHDLDIGYLFHAWEADKDKDISTYRDVSHTSKFTNVKSPVHHTPWTQAMDDSMECYMNTK